MAPPFRLAHAPHSFPSIVAFRMVNPRGLRRIAHPTSTRRDDACTPVPSLASRRACAAAPLPHARTTLPRRPRAVRLLTLIAPRAHLPTPAPKMEGVWY